MKKRPGALDILLTVGVAVLGALAGEEMSRKVQKKKIGVWTLLKTTISRWSDDRGAKMAAALAYYTAFAVAPLLLIAIAVAGLLFGQEAARGEVARQLSGLIGTQGAEAVQDMIARVWRPKASLTAAAAGLVTMLLAATGVFIELQDSLDQIWKVRKRPGRGVLGTLKDRLFSFSIVVGTGFLLLVSLVASAALQAVASRLEGWTGSGWAVEAVNFGISFALIAALFAALFRFLPDARTPWPVVWVGGIVTAFLFSVGKTLIGLYLGRSAVSSTYGAAASFVIFLVWVNYSAQILFLGAELTKTYADLSEREPRVLADAERIECLPVKVVEEPGRPAVLRAEL